MTRPLKTSLVLAAAALVLLGLTISPAAAAKKPSKPACWKVLINDWFDGTIDNKYGLGCYREALRRVKTDPYALGYTDAHDQINRAYHQRRAELAGFEPDSGPTDTTPGSSVTPPKGGNGNEPPASVTPEPRSRPGPGRKQNTGPLQDAMKSFGSDDATSIPIPLIVLAGIAVLLIAAGAATLLARRTRARRVTAPVRPAPPASGS